MLTVESAIALSDLETESACIGACITDIDRVGEVSELVQPADFTGEGNREVMQALLDLHGQGVPADAVTLRDTLQRRGALDRIGGQARLAEFLSWETSPVQAAYYARKVADLARRRRLAKLLQDAERHVADPTADLGEALGAIQSGLLSDQAARTVLLTCLFTGVFGLGWGYLVALAENPLAADGLFLVGLFLGPGTLGMVTAYGWGFWKDVNLRAVGFGFNVLGSLLVSLFYVVFVAHGA